MSMASFWGSVILAALALAGQTAIATQAGSRIHQGMGLNVNPVRRVVTMLQDMKGKIEAEAKSMEELAQKVACQCSKTQANLNREIDEGDARRKELLVEIEEGSANHAAEEQNLKSAKENRAKDTESLEDAKGLRKREVESYTKNANDARTNLFALKKAIKALEAGHGSVFLQTQLRAASILKKLSIGMDMADTERDELASFLSAGEHYAPQSGEILGIIKQMENRTADDLVSLEAAEREAKKKYREEERALEKSITLLTAEIQRLNMAVSELAVTLLDDKQEQADVRTSLATNRALLKKTVDACQRKKFQHEEDMQNSIQEQSAITDAINILNEDDNLEIFKKAMPGIDSLVQLQTTSKALVKEAVSHLHESSGDDFRLNFISLALRGQQVDFTKIKGMIDEMIKILGKEQKNDDDKKAHCETHIDEREDRIRTDTRAVELLNKSIEEHTAEFDKAKEDYYTLKEGLAALQKMVDEETTLRKEQNKAFMEAMNLDRQAKELIMAAKNRLQKYYNPSEYKPPPRREVSREDEIAMKLGAADFVQIASHTSSDAPGYTPDTSSQYKAAIAEKDGVFEFLNTFLKDLNKEMNEASKEEKDAQKDYEQLIEDAKQKKTDDGKQMAQLKQKSLDLNRKLNAMKQERFETNSEISTNTDDLLLLHKDCDWDLANYAIRVSARRGEVESLKAAKAVLNGADYSFVQVAQSRNRLRR